MTEFGDLLVIVPSRGRPHNAMRLLDAVHQTRKLDTHVYLGVDDDDPDLPEYERLFFARKDKGDRFAVSSRKGLSEWTNHAAARHADRYPFLASLGDDMVPRTAGWDLALVRAIKDMGGTGFSYPHDGIREDIPEAWVQSSDIVRELGWMALPECRHFYIDNAIAELGKWAGCIRLCRAVAVDHIHPSVGKAAPDQLNADNQKKIAPDFQAFQVWRKTRMAEDVKKIIALRENKPSAPVAVSRVPLDRGNPASD